jgi:hypothetical protein
MTNRQWPAPLRQGRRETDIDRSITAIFARSKP